ncbi:MAG: hypothetical protein ACRCXC_06845 [Legionella sp.]
MHFRGALSLFYKPQEHGVFYYAINGLDDKNGEEFLVSFQEIPLITQYLDLETNDLHERIDECLAAFTLISKNVNVLDLSYNCLGDMKTDNKLSYFLGAIPESVLIINFSGNYLSKRKAVQLEELFQRLSRKVISISLALHDFCEQPLYKLLNIIQSLPLTLQVFNLSGNYLGEKTTTEIVQLCSTLIQFKELNQLDLRDNFFNTEQITVIKSHLSCVENIYFLNEDLKEDKGMEHILDKMLYKKIAIESAHSNTTSNLTSN